MPEEYLNFDNYQGINMNMSEVPSDYDGIMGVPITYLDKHNPEQFEILGLACLAQMNRRVFPIYVIIMILKK